MPTTTTTTRPVPVEIHIPRGTIVGRGRNVRGAIQWDTVELLADAVVTAGRNDDGSWGYSLDSVVYVCAGGLATVLGDPAE